MNRFIGVVASEVDPIAAVVLGLVMIVFHRSMGRFSAESHGGLARVLPWLYKIPPASLVLRPRAAALLTLALGIVLFLVGGVVLVLQIA